MGEELRALSEADLEQAWQLDVEVFNGDGRYRDAFDGLSEPDRFHGVFENGRLLAMSRVIPFVQNFGGRSVPMGGLSSVGVAPDARGRGLAMRAVRASLFDMYERGECISALFPATTSLYRKLGWELAGALVTRRITTERLHAFGAPRAGRVRQAVPADIPALKALYARIASETPGFLDRTASRWYHLDELWDELKVYVAVDHTGEIDGYVAYRHRAPLPDTYGFIIGVRDIFALNREALEALWALLGSSSTQAAMVEYNSAPEDPSLLLLDEQHERVHGDIRWMLRIVDPTSAIAARGFAPGLDIATEFTLEEANAASSDSALAANAGAYRLEVSGGEGRLERISRAPSLRFGIGAFASLYAGWAQTQPLERLGLLSGGTPTDRANLDAAFAGPTAWLPEEF